MAGSTQSASEVARAYRDPDEGLLGGVAAGLAEHLHQPVQRVRIGFVALALVGGLGVLLYAALWMVLPVRPPFGPTAPGLAAAERDGRRPTRPRRLTDYGPLIAIGTLGAGMALLAAMVTGQGNFLAPVVLGFGGAALLWRQADDAQRQRLLESGERIGALRAAIGSGPWSSVRLVVGVGMLIGAITLVSLGSGGWAATRPVVIAATLGILGIAFIMGPWLLRLSADLGEERAERIRSQERADVAAHLHDSVLQTLALIQRSAEDPGAVLRLARSQERDLRAWLFDPTGTGPSTLAAALRAQAAEVEDRYPVTIAVVCVGDREVDDSVRPLLLATGEALTNAARHARVGAVDLYAEAGPELVEVYVRDRGVGFDPERIDADRHGLRESVVDRMRRHGGTAEIRSSPGTGTEIRLLQPLSRERR